MRVVMLPSSTAAADNPFVSMLSGALRATGDVEVVDFSWRTVREARPPVLHVHWPELLLRARSRRRRALNLVNLVLLVIRHRGGRGPLLVQTVHNAAPHERGSLLERVGLALWRRAVDVSIHLTAPPEAGAPGRSIRIPHGDYRPFVSSFALAGDAARDGLLAFGYIRPYKGLESLIAAVGRMTGERLTVVGAVKDPAYGEAVRRSAESFAAVEVVLGRQEERVLVERIRRSEIVVLPYRRGLNSGAALLALTLSTPVVLSDGPAARELQDESGEEWVALLPERWQQADLALALARLRATAAQRVRSHPLADERRWPSVAAQHLEVYRGGPVPAPDLQEAT